MAGPTRLELATSGVTGRRSNQLNYDPAGCLIIDGRHPFFNQNSFCWPESLHDELRNVPFLN